MNCNIKYNNVFYLKKSTLLLTADNLIEFFLNDCETIIGIQLRYLILKSLKGEKKFNNKWYNQRMNSSSSLCSFFGPNGWKERSGRWILSSGIPKCPRSSDPIPRIDLVLLGLGGSPGKMVPFTVSSLMVLIVWIADWLQTAVEIERAETKKEKKTRVEANFWIGFQMLILKMYLSSR